MEKPENTSPPLKSKSFSMLVPRLSDYGLTMGKSGASKVPVEKDTSTSQTSKKPFWRKKLSKKEKEELKKKKSSSMEESVQEREKRNSKDKLSTSEEESPKKEEGLKSSKTSGKRKISDEREYNLSWEESHQELSHRLWLPTEENCLEKELNSSNGSSENIMLNSWFSTKKKSSSKRIKDRPRLEDPGEFEIELDEEKIPTILRTKKMRMGFEKGEKGKNFKKVIKYTMRVITYIYNKCVELSDKEKVNLKSLRDKLTKNKTSNNILDEEIKEEFEEVPSQIRDEAIRDFMKAYKTQLEKAKKKNRPFEMHYREGHSKTQMSFVLHHKFIKRISDHEIQAFPRLWKNQSIKFKEKLPKMVNHDCRILWTRSNKFYLLIPVDKYVETNLKEEVVALDPGVRTFQTTFDTKGNSYLIGDGDIGGIDKLKMKAQRLRDGIKDVYNKETKTFTQKNVGKKKGLNKAADRFEEKIKNKISDIHRKTAKFLCENYGKVIIPEFETSQMIEKRNVDGTYKRKIGKETSRRMITWSHFAFRQLLIAKGEELGTKIFVGTEELSSKTCTHCLMIKEDLGSAKEYNCGGCGLKIHRDINGARNILMMNWDK